MHENALTEVGARLFPQLREFRNFYLVGGTALALQIGHRLSVDFDLFSPSELPTGLRQKVKKVFSSCDIKFTYSAPEQLNLSVDGMKITFFNFSYPVVDSFVKYQGASLASVREISAMKAFVIGKRLSYKDYIDWYFMLKENHITLTEVIAHAEKKFGGEFNNRLFLGQLISIEDIRNQTIDFLRDEVDRKTVQKFLEDTVRSFEF
jgi:hypothetical protein